MSEFQCPVCFSSVKLKYKNEKDINFHLVQGTFNWYQCTQCDSLSIHPQVDVSVLSSYYGDDYTPITNKMIRVGANERNGIGLRIKMLKEYFKDGRFTLIDVGCGAGHFLYNLRLHFPEAKLYGNDFNTKFAEKNLEGMDIPLFQGDFSSIPEELKFNIISSSQFMEHIQNPYSYIDLIKKTRESIFYTFNDFPNIYSTTYKVFGRKWVHLDTPRHRILYSKKGMDLLFKNFKTEHRIEIGFSGVYMSCLLLSLHADIQQINKYALIRKLYYGSFKVLDKLLPQNDKVLYVHSYN